MRAPRLVRGIRTGVSRVAERRADRGRTRRGWDDIERQVGILEEAVAENRTLDDRLAVVVRDLEDQLVPLLADERKGAS